MKKQQIEIHGEVIKWFCDNPELGVWCKFENCNEQWELRFDPKFEVFTRYVQNDEYAEFRKAREDGKTIQVLSPAGYEDTDEYYNFQLGTPKDHKIKAREN